MTALLRLLRRPLATYRRAPPLAQPVLVALHIVETTRLRRLGR